MKLISNLYILLISLALSGAYAQNAPISSIGVEFGYGSEIVVSITGSGISNIAGCNHQILYDPDKVSVASVTKGTQLPGIFNYNTSVPGVITIGWFTWPGVTLPDSSNLFNITFNKVANGTSLVLWDFAYPNRNWSDGNSVMLNDHPLENHYHHGAVTFLSTDAPVTAIDSFSVCSATVVDIPVIVSNFTNIGSFSLSLNYNENNLVFQSFTNNSAFPGFYLDATSPGYIAVEAYSNDIFGVSLPDGSVLFTIQFLVLDGVTELAWHDCINCHYTGPAPAFQALNQIPHAAYYSSGYISSQALPGSAGYINGPAGGNVCQGQTGVEYSIEPIEDVIFYNWLLPPGAYITVGDSTNIIIVSFDPDAGDGFITVSGVNECGGGDESPAFPVLINLPPIIIHQPQSPDTVNAGDGIAIFEIVASGSQLTYQWQEFVESWEDLSEGGIYSGTSTPTLVLRNPTAGMDGNFYRCIISGFCEPDVVSDGTAQLHVRNITGVWDRITGHQGSDKDIIVVASPNPFKEQINLTLTIPGAGRIQIEIIDRSGKVITDKEIQGIKEGMISITIPASGFPQGLYLANIRLVSAEFVRTQTVKLFCVE